MECEAEESPRLSARRAIACASVVLPQPAHENKNVF